MWEFKHCLWGLAAFASASLLLFSAALMLLLRSPPPCSDAATSLAATHATPFSSSARPLASSLVVLPSLALSFAGGPLGAILGGRSKDAGVGGEEGALGIGEMEEGSADRVGQGEGAPTGQGDGAPETTLDSHKATTLDSGWDNHTVSLAPDVPFEGGKEQEQEQEQGGEEEEEEGDRVWVGEAGIVGSKLNTSEQALRFRIKWDCVASLKGRWVKDLRPRVLPWTSTDTRLPCWTTTRWGPTWGPRANALVRQGRVSAANWTLWDNLKYVWVALPRGVCGKHQRLSPFDAPSLCASLRSACNRSGSDHIFVVGDSLMGQFVESLFDQLRMNNVPVVAWPRTPGCLTYFTQHFPRNLHDKKKNYTCHSHLICGASLQDGGVLLHFVFSTFLQRVAPGGQDVRHLWIPASQRDTLKSPLVDERLHVWRDTREYAWVDDAVALRPAIVVLNRGAHFVPTQWFIPQLSYALRQIRRRLPDSLLVYRSTAPGHVGCDKYKRPLSVLPVISSPVHSGGVLAPYHWEDFELQNQAAKRLIEHVGGVYLNIFHMSALRPDWHRIYRSSKPIPERKAKGRRRRKTGPESYKAIDCLHFCAPGPVDTWVQLFTSMLTELV